MKILPYNPDSVEWEALSEPELDSFYSLINVMFSPAEVYFMGIDYGWAERNNFHFTWPREELEKLGIKIPRSPAWGVWAEKDTEFLVDDYLELTDDQLATVLNKTARQVKSKRAQLGLIRKTKCEVK